MIQAYQRRRDLLVAAQKALEALKNDGYPEHPKRTVPNEQFANLQDQLRTMTAALGRFSEEGFATSLNLQAGTIADK